MNKNYQSIGNHALDACAAAFIPGSVEIHGYGEGGPVAPNATAAGRPKNRRVEITHD